MGDFILMDLEENYLRKKIGVYEEREIITQEE